MFINYQEEKLCCGDSAPGKPVSAQNPASVTEKTSLQVALSHKWSLTPLSAESATGFSKLLQKVEGWMEGRGGAATLH